MYSASAALHDDWGMLIPTNRTPSATEMGSLLKKISKPEPETFIADNELQIYSVIQKIRSLKSWGENWDGAGAAAINQISIASAVALIRNLYVVARQIDIEWLEPNVTASPHGEVVLEWWNYTKKLTVYVNEDQLDFIKVWGPDIDHEMEDGQVSEENSKHLLAWLEV